MAAARRESCNNLVRDTEKITVLREQLIARMLRIPGVFLTGSREDCPRMPGTVHFCIEGVEAETMLALLDARGICASAGSTCSAGALAESHVSESLGIPPALAAGALQLSLDAENTAADVTQILLAVHEITAQLRKE